MDNVSENMKSCQEHCDHCVNGSNEHTMKIGDFDVHLCTSCKTAQEKENIMCAAILDAFRPLGPNLKIWHDAQKAKNKDYDDDMELMGKQHMLVNGLKCQNGCDNYATEKVLGVADNGMPIDKLVCEACAFGGVE